MDDSIKKQFHSHNECIHVAVCIDNNFSTQCAILLTSLLTSNWDNQFTIYVITEGLSEKNKSMLVKIAKKHGALISFLKIDNTLLQNFPVREKDYISLATYYRIFFPTLLPKTLSKLLYLDSDIIVTGNIAKLWNIPLQNYALAATYDIGNNDIRFYNRLKYDYKDGYFNAGVLLINLSYWRKHNIESKAIAYIANFPERCLWHDQDALNAVLHGSVKFISAKYNTLITFFKINPENELLERNLHTEILSDIQHPCIIHFAGGIKPWHYEYHKLNYPFAKLWQFYQAKSHAPLIYTHKYLFSEKTIRNNIKLFLFRIGLKEPPRDYFIDTSVIEQELLEQNRTEQNRTEQNRTEQTNLTAFSCQVPFTYSYQKVA